MGTAPMFSSCSGHVRNNLMMQARNIEYDVIGADRDEKALLVHAVFGIGEELFLGTCENRGVGGIGVLVNTHSAMNIDSYESLTARIGRLQLRRFGSSNHLRCLRTNIKLRIRGVGSVLHGSGVALQRRPYFL
ncbi:unnamed protein product [Haemonchus placei]|uniref:Acyl-CoA_dh_1 domain-containing protein n=1 Tax=Haemonchus placei TaxID=6290 RepID=A0A0N4WK00_HAEPC|nr:unnamed protein product [Haemonchus placei]